MDITFLNYYIYGVILYYIKIVTSFLFFCPNLKNKRERFVPRLIIAIVITLGISFGFCYLYYNTLNYFVTILYNIVLFSTMVFSYYLIFDYKVKDSTIVIVISYCVQHIAYQIIYLLFASWIFDIFDTSSNSTLYYVFFYIDIFLQIILNFLLSWFLQGIYKKNYKYSISLKKVFGFSIASIFVVSILYTRIYLSDGFWASKEVQVVTSLFCVLSCLLILFLILGVFSVNKYRDEAIETRVFNDNIIKQYKKSQEAVEYINIKCHDLRKRLREYKNNNELFDDEEIENIASAITIYENTFNTGNETLDKVLNSRSLLIQQHNINLTAMCDSKELSLFKEHELISLFVNIIDNAIEAVIKLDKTSNRNISLVIKNKSGFLYIEETNHYKDPIQIKDNYLVTNKDDKENHGYGTRSIARTIKKHKGKVEYETENNIFSIKILIPLNE